MLYQCNKCKGLFDQESFYKDKDGRLKRSRCKNCTREYRREHQRTSEQKLKRRERNLRNMENPAFVEANKIRGSKYYSSLKGRAKTLLASANRRSSEYGEDFDLTESWFIDKLKVGKCELTGIDFDLNKPIGTSKNPYSPSIDRIDSNKGYTKANCRVVLWQVNLALGEMSDSEIIPILEKLLEGLREREC